MSHFKRHITSLFITLLSVMMVFYATTFQAQDSHFTQFTQIAQSYSPAVISDFKGDVRASAHYRRQWSTGVKGYTTQACDLAYRFKQKKEKTSYFSAGIFVLNDQAGQAAFKTFRAMGTGAFTVSLNSKNRWSAAVQAGYLQRSIDVTGLAWDEQYDGMQYDPSLPTMESTFSDPRDKGMDIGAGVHWKHEGKIDYSFGYAFNHLGQDQTILLNGEDRLPIRQCLTGSMYHRFMMFALTYDVVLQRQRGAMEILGGIRGEYRFGDDSRYTDYKKSSAAYAGVYYRHGDAISPVVGFEWKRTFALHVSFDFPISNVYNIVVINGGPELTLVYLGAFTNKQKINRSGI